MDFFGLAIELGWGIDINMAELKALQTIRDTNASPDEIHNLFNLLREQQEEVYEAAR